MSGERHKIPLIILGGGDPEPARLPPGGRGKHPLRGCKGVDVRIGDKILVEHVIERFRQTGAFDPVIVAGPADAYRQAGVDVELVDTDLSFGENIRAALEHVLETRGEQEVAFTTCDILPKPQEVRALLDDYWAHYPCDLWFPVVKVDAPERLGASDWKPKYGIPPEPGEQAVMVLPGHLAIVDPRGLRLEFLYRLFELGYRSRNRPIRYRSFYLLRHVILSLVIQDIRHVLGLRLPTLTWDVARHGVAAARRLRLSQLPRSGVEAALRRIFVKRRHRKRYPDRQVRLPLTSAMSLARDIDTVEEARAFGASAEPIPAR